MNKGKSISDTTKKQASTPNTVQRKLDVTSSRLAKAIALTAETELKLKEIKGKDTQSQEGSVLGYNAAEKFQQNVASYNERRDAVSFKSLKNFKRMRKTIFETSSIQVFENEIEKLLDEGRTANQGTDDEIDFTKTSNFYFSDNEFGPTDKDPSGLKSIGPGLSEQVNHLHWPQISEIADMGAATFIENIGDITNPESTFWVKNIIQGQCDNLAFLK